ncbi:MAG: nitronate monooxygenase [Candidatus Dormibacteraeota bacterium]|uniref:Propionate 3-nitronate monooxygenase n=1 Tax=Candidatus Aeolococcus gillhamiae TaxID=3127015 RepID=A0A934JWC8_9BACT|nr:nitronate monooxygenase [Candidatus Dormibacteraeota bacterium]
MRWPQTRLTGLLGTTYPIVQAAMAGGPSTVDLAVAVSNAGGLGSIAGAILSPGRLRDEIRMYRERTARPFAVNLFAAEPPATVEPELLEAVCGELARHRRRLGLPEPAPPRARTWTLDEQLTVIVDERVPVLSFTFGIVPIAGLEGIVTIGTATTVGEALALEGAGVDAIVVQGAEAGGHRGTFLGPPADALVGLIALVPQVADAVSVPVIAAGGVVDGRGVAAALTLGAAGVQLGTAFLFCAESGADAVWRQALRTFPSVVSDAYTGRAARGARTPFVDQLIAGPRPAPYEVQRALTADFRCLNGHGWYLGGQAAGHARELPAAELMSAIVEETRAALARLTR